MTRIIYKNVRSVFGNVQYLPTEIHGEGGELVLEFCGAEGRCRIGNKTYRLEGGICRPDTDGLCGSISPMITSRDGAYTCGRFDIKDGRATLPVPTFEELSACLASLQAISERLSYVEGEVRRHDALISGVPLFEFN